MADPEMLPQPGRIVLVMLQDGRQIEGELIVMTGCGGEGDLMRLAGWRSPQMLRAFGEPLVRERVPQLMRV